MSYFKFNPHIFYLLPIFLISLSGLHRQTCVVRNTKTLQYGLMKNSGKMIIEPSYYYIGPGDYKKDKLLPFIFQESSSCS